MQIISYYPLFLNVDNSINIVSQVKYSVAILDMIMEGTVVLYILCDLVNDFDKFYKIFPDIDIK